MPKSQPAPATSAGNNTVSPAAPVPGNAAKPTTLVNYNPNTGISTGQSADLPQYNPWLGVYPQVEQDWHGMFYSPYLDYRGVMVNDEFLRKVEHISYELGINPDDLMTLMATESKIATRISPYGGRGGLLQFIEITVEHLGYGGLDELTAMTAMQQLDVVHDFFKENLDTHTDADPQNIIDLYTLMAGGSRGGFGQGNDYVVIPKSDGAYAGNAPMDMDGVNGITRGDLRNWIDSEMQKYILGRSPVAEFPYTARR